MTKYILDFGLTISTLRLGNLRNLLLRKLLRSDSLSITDHFRTVADWVPSGDRVPFSDRKHVNWDDSVSWSGSCDYPYTNRYLGFDCIVFLVMGRGNIVRAGLKGNLTLRTKVYSPGRRALSPFTVSEGIPGPSESKVTSDLPFRFG